MRAEFPEEIRQRGYTAERQLASHELADTWRARCEESAQAVIVKLLDVRHIETWKDLELFERQKKTLTSLDHPRIPRHIESFRFDVEGATVCALICEFVEGQALDELLKCDGPFDEQEVLTFLDELLEVLEYLHGFTPPVVHRDIKPSNILRGDDGEYVLIDFGAVQTVLSGVAGGTTFVGTDGYMPPEQMMGKAVAASDIYALGATAIQLLSGHPPRELRPRGLEFEFHEYVDVSDSTRRVLEWMVEPDVDHRASQPAAVRRALDTGVIPEDASDARSTADTPRDHWNNPPEEMTLSCRLLPGDDDERNHVEVAHPRSTGWIVEFSIGLLFVCFVAVCAQNLIVPTIVTLFAVFWIVAAGVVTVMIVNDSKKLKRNMKDYYKHADRPLGALPLVLLAPWMVMIAGIKSSSSFFTQKEERLLINDRGLEWTLRENGGGQRRFLPASSVREIDLSEDDALIVRGPETVRFDTTDCSDREVNWLAEGLKMELEQRLP